MGTGSESPNVKGYLIRPRRNTLGSNFVLGTLILFRLNRVLSGVIL